jgi:hypothetical protein
MRKWFVRVAAPFWAALYFVIFYLFGVPIFISTMLTLGVWQALGFLTVLFGVWGTIFYLILLQSESFDRIKNSVESFLSNQSGKVFLWIRKVYHSQADQSAINPALIMLIFIVQNPLVGVPLIRFSYSKKQVLSGVFWVWVGALLKVLTWYFPIYGGGLSLLRAFWF